MKHDVIETPKEQARVTVILQEHGVTFEGPDHVVADHETLEFMFLSALHGLRTLKHQQSEAFKKQMRGGIVAAPANMLAHLKSSQR